jgi:hypothetical protein
MKSENSTTHKPRREFGGCVELIPARPDYTEFIDSHRSWAFPISYLTHFLFQENPYFYEEKNLPPDQLILVYSPATVILRGWRLELMLPPLVSGRIARVHAEKHLGALILDEAWVSEIHVVLNDNWILDREKLGQRIWNQP